MGRHFTPDTVLSLINTLTYLLTDQFLVDRYVWQFYGITAKPGGVKFFLLQGLECYKNTQIKAYDNTTNRPRSNISVTL